MSGVDLRDVRAALDDVPGVLVGDDWGAVPLWRFTDPAGAWILDAHGETEDAARQSAKDALESLTDAG